jgi:hypothetical protein
VRSFLKKSIIIQLTKKSRAFMKSRGLSPSTRKTQHCLVRISCHWKEKPGMSVDATVCTCAYSPRHEDVWGSERITPSILNYDIKWARVWASRCGCFIPGIHFIGGWVGFRVGMDVVTKYSCCWESNLGCAARSQSLYWLNTSLCLLSYFI